MLYAEDYYKRHKPKMDALNIDESKIPNLEKYVPLLAKTQQQAYFIDARYGSVLQLLKYMYWLRFVLNYNYAQIRRYTTVDGFTKYYYIVGWGIKGKTLEEAVNNFQESIKEFVKAKENFSLDLEVFQQKEFLKAVSKLSPRLEKIKLVKTERERYNLENKLELYKLYYYYLNVAKMTSAEIASLYGASPATTLKTATNFNLQLTRSESRARAESHGRGNHDVSFQSITNNKIEILLSNGISGNVAENVLRMALGNEISKYLPSPKYNIIVGLPTYTIAYPKEIDIPLLVIDTETKQVYRYAIELCGIYFHAKIESSKRDLEKIEIMLNTKWKLIMVIQTGNSSSVDKDKFNETVRELAEFISEDVVNPKDWKFKRFETI